MNKSTIYELSWGSAGSEGQTRYFGAHRHTDAAVRLSERILELDRSPVNAAWAHLKRLPDSVYPEGLHLVGWTKTSDERPTDEGSTTIPE